jgi:hypothetical protein
MAKYPLISVSKAGVTLLNTLNITNSQSTPTQAGLQVMWQVPVSTLQARIPWLNSSLSNLRFLYNGQYIPAWLESINNGTATIWIKIPVSIPANSSITLNLYSNSTLNFDGIYWGEAPQLSSTYGQYDNGASVFNNYWNFAGTTLPSGWITSSYLTATVNNGVKLTSTSSNQYLGYSTSFPTPIIVDIYGKVTTGVTAPANLLNMFGNALGTYTEWGGLAYNNGYVLGYSSVSGTWTYTTTSWTINTFYIITHTSSGTSQSYQINYNQFGTSSINLSSPYIMSWQGASTTFVQWLRTRAYPPNGVMPTVELM